MRANGTLCYQSTIGKSGIDSYGAPIVPDTIWSEPIPCSITTNTDNRLGKYEDGVFHKASYTILIEPTFMRESAYLVTEEDIPVILECEEETIIELVNRLKSAMPDMNFMRVRLERNGEDLGEYNLISAELISSMERIKIVV